MRRPAGVIFRRRSLRPAFRRARRLIFPALCGLLLATGCARNNASSPGRVDRDPNVLVAYVCCSLVPAMEVAQEQFEAANEGKSIRIDGGEPSALVERIRSGAVPDVLICPGDAEIGILEREGYLDRGSRKAIATLQLAIAVPADRPTPITNYEDLTSSQVRSITMSTQGITSPGTDGKHALERLGLWLKIQDKLVIRATPLETLKLVAEGEVDAGIIYDPCPRLRMNDEIPIGSVRVAARLTTSDERATRVHIILHKRSPNALLAQRFIRLLTSEDMRPALSEAGLADAGTETDVEQKAVEQE